jgi:hypothetical protein
MAAIWEVRRVFSHEVTDVSEVLTASITRAIIAHYKHQLVNAI